MYVISCVLSSWSVSHSILHDKICNIGYYVQVFKPIYFIPAMLNLIELYYFIPFTVALTLAEGYKVSRKQNLLD